jgi:hypothetical protein
MTIAGRTLRLVKSVKGIGSRTTSFLEQFIEDVVSLVVPGFYHRSFGKFHPSRVLRVTFNGDARMGFFRQRKRLGQQQFSVLMNGVNGRRHGRELTTSAKQVNQVFWPIRKQDSTFNIEHSTPNESFVRPSHWILDVECWLFDVSFTITVSP